MPPPTLSRGQALQGWGVFLMLTQGDALGYIMLPLQGESFETIVTQPDGLGYDILAFQAVKCTHKLRLKVAPETDFR